jgi:hypothetical protein
MQERMLDVTVDYKAIERAFGLKLRQLLRQRGRSRSKRRDDPQYDAWRRCACVRIGTISW